MLYFLVWTLVAYSTISIISAFLALIGVKVGVYLFMPPIPNEDAGA
jgi:hypothetical protein